MSGQSISAKNFVTLDRKLGCLLGAFFYSPIYMIDSVIRFFDRFADFLVVAFHLLDLVYHLIHLGAFLQLRFLDVGQLFIPDF